MIKILTVRNFCFPIATEPPYDLHHCICPLQAFGVIPVQDWISVWAWQWQQGTYDFVGGCSATGGSGSLRLVHGGTEAKDAVLPHHMASTLDLKLGFTTFAFYGLS